METDYKELYEFIKDQRGDDVDDNSPNYGLEKDLGIYGDDADDFLIAFSKKFNVNLDDFNMGKYFSPEGSYFFNIKLNRLTQKYELRINDLKEAIKTGKLI